MGKRVLTPNSHSSESSIRHSKLSCVWASYARISKAPVDSEFPEKNRKYWVNFMGGAVSHLSENSSVLERGGFPEEIF